MRKFLFFLCFITFCFTPLLQFGMAGDPPAEGAITLTGEYVWARRDGDRPGDIKAVFTPVKEGEWAVAFYFDFRDKAHVYQGTAKGKLDNGALKGTVKNDGKNRTFRFEGTTTNGTFTGTHLEEGGRGDADTGRISLSPAE